MHLESNPSLAFVIFHLNMKVHVSTNGMECDMFGYSNWNRFVLAHWLIRINKVLVNTNLNAVWSPPTCMALLPSQILGLVCV